MLFMSGAAPVRMLPNRVRLEASSFCQLRCPSCPTTTGAIGAAVGGGFLRIEDFRKFVDANPFVRQIEISNYGEIFLNPQLVSILEYAHRKNVAITIENGVNLNHVKEEQIEALVKYQVRIVTCSIDGASPETYRVYRVRGDFDVVMENIGKINACKARYGSQLPRLVWQFVIFGHNEHELPLARQMAARLGMEFRPKLTWDDKFSPIRDKAFVRAQIAQRAVTREEFEREHGEKYASGICHQLWRDPQINWDGRILGCCRNFWGDFGGNAFTDGAAESLNNEKMVYARGMLTGQNPPRDDIPCTTCELYEGMRTRSRFIAPREVKREPADAAARTGVFRPEVQTRIAEVDTELAAIAAMPRAQSQRRVQSLKDSMAAPLRLPRAERNATPPSPAVSIVLPTYNRAGFLGEAIASVQAQSFADWELLVIDDGSSDGTGALAANYRADPRIRFVAQRHTGHAAARNLGLRLARGALIAYLDSDNLWFPHFLAAAVPLLHATPAADCVYGAMASDLHPQWPHGIVFERFDRARLLRENFIDLNTLVHRRSLIEIHGGFDERLDRLVDWDLVLRLTRDKPALRIPVLAVQYRAVDGQRVSAGRSLQRNRAAIRRKWAAPLLRPVDVPLLSRLMRRISRRS